MFIIIFFKIDFLKDIISLQFLPAALNMFNGNINSNTFKFKSIEVFINCISAGIINLIDFCLLSIIWIPHLKKFLNFIYRTPDTIEKSVSFLFGGNKGHRNFVTHSIFNPLFLGYLFLSSKICIIFSDMQLSIIFKYLLFLIGLCFPCHLLSDTMPNYWKGFANIKVYLFTNLYTFRPLISKSWLYIGSFLSFMLLYKFIFLI